MSSYPKRKQFYMEIQRIAGGVCSADLCSCVFFCVFNGEEETCKLYTAPFNLSTTVVIAKVLLWLLHVINERFVQHQHCRAKGRGYLKLYWSVRHLKTVPLVTLSTAGIARVRVRMCNRFYVQQFKLQVTSPQTLDLPPPAYIPLLQDGNQGKHRVTKRGPALSYPMFTLVTGIVGRWRAGVKPGPKNITKRKCATCNVKMPPDWEKKLCQPCTDKIVRAEHPSLIDEIRSLVRQEVQTSLATLAPPPPPPPSSPGPSLPKKRKIQEYSESESEGSYTSSSVKWEDAVPRKSAEIRKYLFSSEYIEELVSAVRNTMGLKEESVPQSIQDELFGIHTEKQPGFPVHKSIIDMINNEWELPEKRLTTPPDFKHRFPLEEDLIKWDIPKIDVQVARVAKKTALPFEDSSQLKDPLDRKIESLLKKSWETSTSALRYNIASTCVARSLFRWIQELESHISQGTPREEVLDSLPILHRATGFLADASLESIRVAARSLVQTNSARRALWLKMWSGDVTSKIKLCSIPFKGDYVFGPSLDDILEKATDRKKTLPEQRPPRNPSPPRVKGKEKPGGGVMLRGSLKTSLFPNKHNKKSNDSDPVGGRLSNFVHSWQNISNSPWVVSVIQQGLLIEFDAPPPRILRVTSPSSRETQKLMMAGIQDLLDSRAISIVPVNEQGEGHYSRIFMIKKPSGQSRIIINMKALNKYITYRKFKMESVKTAIPLIAPHSYMATIDLKDAYFHIPIHPRHRKYLRFAVQFNQKILHFQYNVLPFGISSAPRVFSRVMAEAVAHIRSQDIAIVPYLDDLLIIGPSAEVLNRRKFPKL
ncbi:unnamed protein product [Ranitomeya imitator]|uniref:ribonuclease H n=1 Tax=Ranitomeya imitator TaxID=111125 RepID=A0ABN9MB80_9NEOB|nr:unnamed protein product [Ranitomeya imitator]